MTTGTLNTFVKNMNMKFFTNEMLLKDKVIFPVISPGVVDRQFPTIGVLRDITLVASLV